LGIELTFLPPSPVYLPWPSRRPKSESGGRARVHSAMEFGYNKKAMSVFVESMNYRTLPNQGLQSEGLELRISRDKAGRYRGILSQGEQRADIGEGVLHKFHSFTPRLRRRRSRETDFLAEFTARELAGLLENELSKLFYLGPVREPPRRLYVATGQAPQDVGLRGELSVDVLWIRGRRKKEREKLMGSLNRWMKAFGIAERVELRRLGGNNYFVTLKDPSTGLQVNLADVGFGASQVLPIVVEGFYAPPDATLLVEQPEIHLHPRAQAILGDLFVEIVRQGGVRRLVVETHSEHMIRRLQRRIAEGRLQREDLAIYYCAMSPDGTLVKEIVLDEKGAFAEEGLPAGFFEEAFLESKAQYEAVAQPSVGSVTNAAH